MKKLLPVLLIGLCGYAQDFYTVSPTNTALPTAGGSGSVTITAPAWTASSPVPWITVSPTTGSGSGSVGYSVQANTGGARTGAVSIAGQTLTVTQAAAPPPPVTNQWVLGFGGELNDAINSVVLDASGNTYAAGTVSKTFTVPTRSGPVNVVSSGGSDLIFLKVAPDGVIEWVRAYGGTGDEASKKILLDSAGNLYLGGTFNGLCRFGNQTPTVQSVFVDGFIAKYSPTGDLVWSQIISGPGNDYVNDIALDVSQANLVATGNFSDTARFFGTLSLTSDLSGPDTFLLKCSTGNNGALTWARNFPSKNYDSGQVVCVGADNSIYLSGFFRVSISLGGPTFFSTGGTFLYDVYVGKFADSGAMPTVPIWSRSGGGDGSDYVNGGAVDAIGDFVIGGSFGNKAANFGTGTITGTGTTTDGWIAKYSSGTGAAIWSQAFPCLYSGTIASIAFDGSSNPVIAGSFNKGITFPIDLGSVAGRAFGEGDGFMARCDGARGFVRVVAGVPQFTTFGGVAADGANAVTVDPSGAATVTGFYQNATFPTANTNLVSRGFNDAFLLRVR